MATKKRKTQEVLFEYLVDQQATQRVNVANSKIQDGFDRMQKSVKRGGIAGIQELRKLEKESQEALKDINALRAGVNKLDKSGASAFDSQISSIKEYQTQLRLAREGVRDFDEESTQVRQQVGGLGDIGSAGRTLGGLGGKAGLAGLDQGIAAISEIPDSLEALAQLKPVLVGAPSAIKSVASALGPVGLGLTAVALVGVAVFAKLSSELNKAKEEAKALAEAQAKSAKVSADIQQQLAAGDLESAAQTIGETLKQRENANLQIEKLERDLFNARVSQIEDEKGLTRTAAEDFVNAMSELDLRDKFDDANRLDEKLSDLFDPGQSVFLVRELQNQIDSLRTGELNDLDMAFQAQGEAIDQYGVSLIDLLDIYNDVTAGQEELGKELIKQAETTRQNFLKEQALLEQSTDQLNERLEAIENDRQSTQLAIDELEKSSIATEEMTAQLDAYNLSLQVLSDEQAFINEQAMQTAQLREQEIEQQDKLKEKEEERLKQQKESMEAADKALQERADMEKKFSDDLIDISKRTADESAKALEKLQEKLKDVNRTLERDLANQQLKNTRKQIEAQIKGQREETDEFIKHRRTLLDIQEDANNSEDELQQARDFRGVFNLRRNTRKRIQDEQKDLTRRLEDNKKKQALDRIDRLAQFQQERSDRLDKFRQDQMDVNRQHVQEQIAIRQNSINSIMLRRQQFAQEQQDLIQQSGALLGIRRQLVTAEVQLMQSAFSAAVGMLGQLRANQSQSFAAPLNGIAAFGAGAAGAGAGNNSTTNNVNGSFTVNPTPAQSVEELGKKMGSVLKGLLS